MSVEQRIRAQWKSKRRQNIDRFGRALRSRSEIIMELAVQWDKPCAKIRQIIGSPGPSWQPRTKRNYPWPIVRNWKDPSW